MTAVRLILYESGSTSQMGSLTLTQSTTTLLDELASAARYSDTFPKRYTIFELSVRFATNKSTLQLLGLGST